MLEAKIDMLKEQLFRLQSEMDRLRMERDRGIDRYRYEEEMRRREIEERSRYIRADFKPSPFLGQWLDEDDADKKKEEAKKRAEAKRIAAKRAAAVRKGKLKKALNRLIHK